MACAEVQETLLVMALIIVIIYVVLGLKTTFSTPCPMYLITNV